jgi:hypothetical protein
MKSSFYDCRRQNPLESRTILNRGSEELNYALPNDKSFVQGFPVELKVTFANCTESKLFQSEKKEKFDMLVGLFLEMCPSITGGIQAPECKGQDCLHAHSVNELRRGIFDQNGGLVYTNFPCSSQYINTGIGE